MKRIITILICAILLLPSSVKTHAVDEISLSDMTASECLDFIKQQGVEIPDDLDEETWAIFVKSIIEQVEQNPYCEFVFSYSVTLAFANEIKRVVNNYHNISSVQTSFVTGDYTTLADHYTLQDSVATGAWISAYADFNCYIYAIGIPDILKTNPGYFSGQSYSLSLGVYGTADRVIDDLEELGYERVFRANTMDTSNLCTNESIICVRLGDYDYHFMKYDAGDWYHKPGESAILRYKYTPSVMRVWTNEAYFQSGAVAGEITYDSPIVYISYNGHDWNYTRQANGTHIKSCSICGDSASVSCSWEYTSNGDGTHKRSCSNCSSISNLYCELDYSYIGSNSHTAECADCGYVSSAAACTPVCESNGDGTHGSVCNVCGNNFGNVTCTFAYLYTGNVNGSNTHKYACTECDYSAFGSTVCTYKNSDFCSFCGIHKDAVMQTSLKVIKVEE